MPCPEVPIQQIFGTECIGDSLPKINNNFTALGDATCNLITKVDTLSTTAVKLSAIDSPTIDFSYNSSTGTLSAEVKTDSIRYSHLASWQTLSGSPTLSAEAVQPRLAKAWVNFDGTTNPPTIRSSFNINSVTKSYTGIYTIFFTTHFTNVNYTTVFGGWNNANGNGGWQSTIDWVAVQGAQPWGTTRSLSSIQIATFNSTNVAGQIGVVADQVEVDVVFFGN